MLFTPDGGRTTDGTGVGARRRIPTVVRAVAVLLVVEAITMGVVGTRMLESSTMPTAVLGAASVSLLADGVPAGALLLALAALVTLAAVFVPRRSRTALLGACLVQALVVADAGTAIARGLPLVREVALLVVAAAVLGLALRRDVRRWCDVPVFEREADF